MINDQSWKNESAGIFLSSLRISVKDTEKSQCVFIVQQKIFKNFVVQSEECVLYMNAFYTQMMVIIATNLSVYEYNSKV